VHGGFCKGASSPQADISYNVYFTLLSFVLLKNARVYRRETQPQPANMAFHNRYDFELYYRFRSKRMEQKFVIFVQISGSKAVSHESTNLGPYPDMMVLPIKGIDSSQQALQALCSDKPCKNMRHQERATVLAHRNRLLCKLHHSAHAVHPWVLDWLNCMMLSIMVLCKL
jgi:hypothetical protein